jgi:hypothetical protein
MTVGRGYAGTVDRNRWHVLVRVMLIAVGSGALAWAATVAPVFWQQSRLDQMADRMIRGALVNIETLRALVPDAVAIEQRASPSPAGLRSVAVMRLALAEEALGSGDRDHIDSDLAALDLAVARSLSQSPADAFLWLAAFRSRNLQGRFGSENLALLRMSYALGPREGWIAIKRNRFALALYPQLPADLREDALHEFAALVASGIFEEAAGILTGPVWPLRDRLLEQLASVDYRDRQRFASVLAQGGYDVPVPGVEAVPQRPWR